VTVVLDDSFKNLGIADEDSYLKTELIEDELIDIDVHNLSDSGNSQVEYSNSKLKISDAEYIWVFEILFAILIIFKNFCFIVFGCFTVVICVMELYKLYTD
jgi:hypothetical protein